ncbi:FxLYD domain-containing protein [Micromonospora sp. ATA51]|uniref:FxLYD domain-containing protein n=1 Tax=Micromonospora sp. ATA51 TaxID=2806098 RepID=UPI001A3C177B|nr:FxLYD domain-containing protein [Micromonospora sp. ATA51]MBM0226252.1 hypothetical protein [Micromonospora sp. ATA51]
MGGTDDLRSVEYAVDQLAAFPPVAAALDHTPDVLSAIRLEGEMRDEFSATRADLCAELWVGTGDGLRWELSFGDGVNFIVLIGSEFFPEDLLEEALAAQPSVDSVYHYDREVFHVRMARIHQADEMAAAGSTRSSPPTASPPAAAASTCRTDIVKADPTVTITKCSVKDGGLLRNADIEYTIKNNTGSSSSYSIRFDVLDSSGTKVGDGTDYISDVGGGQTARGDTMIVLDAAGGVKCEVGNVS